MEKEEGIVPDRLGAPVYEVKAELFKAMGHPVRVRVLEVLAAGDERSVSDLAAAVEVEASHLSQQLAVLRRAGLVSSRREVTTVYYSVKDPLVVDLLAVARRLLISGLEESRELLADLQAAEAQQ
ncbi:MAG: ArsR/SmtB family transcription factor [Acidimicrobiales bacterium]